MEEDDFRKAFLEGILAGAEADRTFFSDRFIEESGTRLTEAEEVSDFETCRFEGVSRRTKKRMQVDGYSFDETDGSLMLCAALYEGAPEVYTITQSDAARGFSALRAFIEEAMSGRLTDGAIEESAPGFGLASDIATRLDSIVRIRLYLVSDGKLSSRIKDWPEEEIAGITTEFHIWDIARFQRAFESASGRDDLDIDFSEFGAEGLPCLKAGEAAGEYEAYLCMIPGDVLASIYDRYGSRLLEGNVRSFLSTKGKVNTGILTTIKREPAMFFAFNNGIAATAESVECESSGDGLRLVKATNLQIVNGGQTTASLANAKRKQEGDLTKVFVQMKLSVVTGERSADLIPNIAKYANSQNKVSDADFFSNHPYHIRLEELSRRLFAPAVAGRQYGTRWFYERARGQYLNEQSKMTKAQRAQFLLQNPKNQLLTKTDIAKLENTWRRLPQKVSLGAQKNFMIFAGWITERWAEESAQFNEEYFRRIAALGILFRHTELLVEKQPWYQNGYRANIVTYSLARLREQMDIDAPGLELDLRAIWDRQTVPPEIETALSIFAKSVFDVLVAPDAGIQNVTEWAKKEACWQRIKALRLRLPDSVRQYLVGKDAVRAIARDAKVLQLTDSGIAAQSAVMKIAPSDWRSMKEWADRKKLVTPKESQILGIATMLPARIPSDKQSQILLGLRQRLLDEGYGVSPLGR